MMKINIKTMLLVLALAITIGSLGFYGWASASGENHEKGSMASQKAHQDGASQMDSNSKNCDSTMENGENHEKGSMTCQKANQDGTCHMDSNSKNCDSIKRSEEQAHAKAEVKGECKEDTAPAHSK